MLLILLACRELQEVAPDQGDQELGGVGGASRSAVGVGQGRLCRRVAGHFMKLCVVSWVKWK